jgi:hypothetical protein
VFNASVSLSICFIPLLLSGCWSFPFPSGDTPDSYLSSKKTVKTLFGSTSSEIETKLGAPKWIANKDNKTYYIYEWWSNEADIIMVGYLPMPWIFTSEGTEAHCILLEFDSNQHLVDYKTDTESGGFYSNTPYDCREVFDMQGYAQSAVSIRKQVEDLSEETRERAKAGDPDAMFHVYLGLHDAYSDPVTAWTWLCKAADQGYESARIEVAYWHRQSNWELATSGRIAWLHKAHVRPDDRVAYLWYTLAANGDERRLGIRDDLFTEILSGNEIKEAQDMVHNWKPGQCERELLLSGKNEK